MSDPPFTVDINFIEASKEWMKNKKKKPNGYYIYKCRHWSETHQGYCKNKVYYDGYCKYHHCKHKTNDM